MKLWIDDIRPIPNEDWIHAKTVNEAVRALHRFDFTVISFDHDISHQVTAGRMSRPYPCEECFCAVAYFLGEQYRVRPVYEARPEVIIHTASPVGGREIQQILADYGLSGILRPMGAANRLELEAT